MSQSKCTLSSKPREALTYGGSGESQPANPRKQIALCRSGLRRGVAFLAVLTQAVRQVRHQLTSVIEHCSGVQRDREPQFERMFSDLLTARTHSMQLACFTVPRRDSAVLSSQCAHRLRSLLAPDIIETAKALGLTMPPSLLVDQRPGEIC